MLNRTDLFFQRFKALGEGKTISPTLIYAFCTLLALPSQLLLADEPVNANAVPDNTTIQPVIAPVIVPTTGVASEIAGIIAAQQQPYVKLANFTNRADDLTALYQPQNYAPVWLGHVHAETNIHNALALLENAAAHGLNAANYDTEMLRQKLPTALAATAYRDIALYDTALSLSVLRFLHDLHYGQINPQELHFTLKLREKKLIDLPNLINSSVEQNTVTELASAVEPKLPQYQKLKQALASYQSVIANAPFQKPAANQSELRRFLAAVGDLEDEKNGSLSVALKSFQKRHGLAADGALGKGTAAAINVPLSQRVSQIELAMERLRWLPEERSEGQSIIVNIPSFQLWAFDDLDEFNADINNMRVVVGKALENQTPILMAEMSFIDFVPYWNVPYNIVKKEILPKLLKNPSYLATQNMEMVTTKGGNRTVGFSSSLSGQLQQGSVRIRQRPGARNALGKVKFIFPNKSDVYLHDTPSKSLFGRSRRDFSHGCVRVANPLGLAEFALKNQQGWTKDSIQRAMRGSTMRRVVLKKPIPVMFFYTTAFFNQNDKLEFYSDIYRHDASLLTALTKREDVSDLALFKQEEVQQPVEPSPETTESVSAPVEAITTEAIPAAALPVSVQPAMSESTTAQVN